MKHLINLFFIPVISRITPYVAHLREEFSDSIANHALRNPVVRSSALAIMICTVTLSTSAFGQSMSLTEVLGEIRRNNPALKQYEHKAQALDAYAEGARSWMAPMVGAGTFMTPYPGQETMGSRGSIMFTVEQTIPSGARNRANETWLRSQSDQQRSAQQVQFNQLRVTASKAYYQWYVAERKRGVLQANVRTLQLMKQLAEVRLSFNQSSAADIYQLTGRIATLENQDVAITGEIAGARSVLQSLMNRPVTEALMLDTTSIELSGSEALDTVEFASRRSDIALIDQQIRSAGLKRSFEQSQAKPEFKVRFDHMQSLNNMPNQFSAMAMISIPIAPWSSRMYKAGARAMEYEILAMEEERRAVLSDARGKINGLLAGLQASERQLEGYTKTIIPALQRNVDLLLVAYEENRSTLSAVLDGWEALNIIQLEYVERLERYYNGVVELQGELER